jgi:hypothetical protein
VERGYADIGIDFSGGTMSFRDTVKPQDGKQGRMLDHFESAEEFAFILDEAESRTRFPNEGDFVEGLRSKFAQFEDKMFLSEKQANWLRKIADRSNETGDYRD